MYCYLLASHGNRNELFFQNINGSLLNFITDSAKYDATSDAESQCEGAASKMANEENRGRLLTVSLARIVLCLTGQNI